MPLGLVGHWIRQTFFEVWDGLRLINRTFSFHEQKNWTQGKNQLQLLLWTLDKNIKWLLLQIWHYMFVKIF